MSESEPSYDVRVYAVDARKGVRRTSYRVRWAVSGRSFSDTFTTRKLADSFRSGLVQATRNGEPFDRDTGRPQSEARAARADRLWVDLAREFIDARWEEFSPRHRKSTVEGLVTITSALVREGRTPKNAKVLREALTHWEFNTAARGCGTEPPEQYREALRWIAANSLPLERLRDGDGVRLALRALGTTLDGSRASAATIARKRAALSGALNFAVENRYLPHNPLRDIRQRRQPTAEAVDPRVVVNPDQARALLDAIRKIEPAVHAYFAVLYYAALRPAEARNLRKADLELPETSWGRIVLRGGYQESGTAWTDGGSRGEERHLKHRAVKESRVVPAHPELVAALRTHLDEYGTGVGGRLFVTRTGRGGHPIAAPYQNPVSMSTIYRVLAEARKRAFTHEQVASPLAARPYDLRHAAVSTWLSAGVDATQVAAWAGHGVAVLMRVYAHSLDDRESAAQARIESALRRTTMPRPPFQDTYRTQTTVHRRI